MYIYKLLKSLSCSCKTVIYIFVFIFRQKAIVMTPAVTVDQSINAGRLLGKIYVCLNDAHRSIATTSFYKQNGFMFTIPSEYDQMKRREGFHDRFLAIIICNKFEKTSFSDVQGEISWKANPWYLSECWKNISQWAIVTSLYECGEDE